jgi:hypothetical protein
LIHSLHSFKFLLLLTYNSIMTSGVRFKPFRQYQWHLSYASVGTVLPIGPMGDTLERWWAA